MMTPIVRPIFFLSRLRGGESPISRLTLKRCFLSRLCGGES